MTRWPNQASGLLEYTSNAPVSALIAAQLIGLRGVPIMLTLDVLEPYSNNSSNASSVFSVRLILPHLVAKAVTLGSTGREWWTRRKCMWGVLCRVFGGVLVELVYLLVIQTNVSSPNDPRPHYHASTAPRVHLPFCTISICLFPRANYIPGDVARHR
jgi:hypothetical protein